jgi:long-subunit acyl-CoA synthetase (AMP-forming)
VLAKLGLGRATPSRSCSTTAQEFIPCDLAAVSLGGVPFSIYQTSAPEQIQYLLSDAKSKIAIVEKAFLDRILEARKDLPDLEHVIVVDGEGGDHTLDDLMEMDPDFDPAETVEALEPDDLLTLIYTSGTTGPPKGVQLTHRNLLSPLQPLTR